MFEEKYIGLALLLSGLSHGVFAATQGEELFAIRGYTVSGAALVNSADIEKVIAPFTGENRKFADIEAARQAIRQIYTSRGFTTVGVSVPEQEISDGNIKLAVTEPHLAQIKLFGAKRHDESNIRQSVPALVDGEMPNTVKIAESLRLANENPVKQTQILFKPGKQPNELEALIRVEDTQPSRTFISLDSTGNAATGQTRMGIGWQHANLFNRDQVLTVNFQSSPTQPEDVTILGLGYRVPLYGIADSLDFHAGYSNVDSGTISNDFQVSGKGLSFGARYNFNLTKDSDFEHRIVFGADYRAYQNTVDFLGTPLGTDVTVRPISTTYVGRWESRQTQLSYQAGFSQNISGGQHGRDIDFNAARAGADANYTLFRYGANLRYMLKTDWRINAAFDGQTTNEPLVPGEQFGLGGMNSVRGFGERTLNGDRGWRASVELNGPDIGKKTGMDDAHLRLATFIDAGAIRRLNPQVGETSNADIASVGVGLTFTKGNDFNARLNYGHVVDGGGDKNQGDGRLHASLAWIF